MEERLKGDLGFRQASQPRVRQQAPGLVRASELPLSGRLQQEQFPLFSQGRFGRFGLVDAETSHVACRMMNAGARRMFPGR